MKRLFAIFCILFCGVAQSAQIVNVEYIHKLIEQQHGITVPYNSELQNPRVAANMKYLLTTIDAANSILNGGKITDYGNSEYATTVATDTVATLEMVRDHVRNYKFFATTTPDTTSFSFTISASGVFHIDWGDGTRESYRKTNTIATTYSHEYKTAGEYVVKIGGYRTGGNSISFQNNLNLAKIDGSLGAIFSTIKNKNGSVSNPNFWGLFSGCKNLTGTIPSILFKGIYGQPSSDMFRATFSGCSKLTGSIPENLFKDIYGSYTRAVFGSTFSGCSNLTGIIPSGLFGGMSGKPAYEMFSNTFSGCKGLTGGIPDKVFGYFSGPSAYGMFRGTFSGCSGLIGSIPENLFSGVTGVLEGCAYRETFRNCSGLTGNIPENLFGEITGYTSSWNFAFVFAGCSGLNGNIPDGLFGDLSTITGAMLMGAFSGCSGLTGTSVKINGQFLYDIYSNIDTYNVSDMYQGAIGLTDYADIPSAWK